MPFYVSRYVGSGTHADPYRPALWDLTPSHGTLDMRADATQGNGVAFCWSADNVAGPQVVKLADDKAEQLSTLVNRRLYQELLVAERPPGVDLQDTIRDLLMNPPPGGKPLQRARGVAEIWLAGQLFWSDAPPLPAFHGTITDSFTRSNETPIASPWFVDTGSTGGVNLASNAVTHVTTAGDCLLYHNNNGNGWTADQGAKWNYVSAFTNGDWGPAVRIRGNGNNLDAYVYGQNTFDGGLCFKLLNGVFSTIESTWGTTTTGHTVKITVSGSTIRGYIDDVEVANSPATDSISPITGAGNGAGAFFFDTGGSIDDAELTGENVVGGTRRLMMMGMGQ